MIDQLHLAVEMWHCTCGMNWTHSYLMRSGSDGSLGGHPTPMEEEKLPCKTMSLEDRHVSHCHRCVPLSLGVGWRQHIAFQPKQVKREQDLERDILS